MKRLAAQSAWLLAEQAGGAVIQLSLTAVLVRALGIDEFGHWAFWLACVALSPLVGRGAAAAVLREVSAQPASCGAWLVRAARRLGVGLLGLALLLSLPLAYGEPPARWVPIPVSLWYPFVLSVWLMMGLQELDLQWSAAARATGHYRVCAGIELSGKLLGFSGCCVALHGGHGVTTLVWIVPAVTLVKLVMRAAHLHRLGLLKKGAAPAVPEESFATFAHWQWLKQTGSTVFATADRLLIGVALGGAPLAVYSVCLQLAQLAYQVPAVVLQPLFPWVSRHARLGTDLGPLRPRLIAIGGLTLAGGALAGLGAWYLLPWWLGEELGHDAARIVPIAVLTWTLLALHVGPHYVLLGLGDNRNVALASLCGGLLTLAAQVLLLPWGLVAVMGARCIQGLVLLVNWPRLWRALSARDRPTIKPRPLPPPPAASHRAGSNPPAGACKGAAHGRRTTHPR